jgi:ASC-1-like (ASCH) protein
MSNKQQTVVEWIEQEMLKPNLSMKEILKQAKEMENAKAFEIFKAGQDSMEEGGKGFEQFYNETYGDNK